MGKRYTITVTPRSSVNEIVGELPDGTLKIKLTAAPVDGGANDALIELLSDVWDVPKSKIRIVKGKTSRTKVIEVQ